jgi:hypothetical protein
MQNVVLASSGNTIMVIDLSAIEGSSADYIAANPFYVPYGWTPVLYDFVLPADQMVCIWNGVTVVASLELMIVQYGYQLPSLVENLLEGTAANWRWANGTRLMAMVASSNPKYRHEGEVFLAWYDAVWTKLEIDLAGFRAGTISVPGDAASYMATLPATPTQPLS